MKSITKPVKRTAGAGYQLNALRVEANTSDIHYAIFMPQPNLRTQILLVPTLLRGNNIRFFMSAGKKLYNNRHTTGQFFQTVLLKQT